MTEYFKAPWSKSLKWISWVTIFVICGGAAFFIIKGLYFVAPLLSIVIFASAPFTIRGYSITQDALLVHRLFWDTRFPLTDLQSAELIPDAMRHSIRTAGNGGLFSFSGYFSNKTLGDYRALVTNPGSVVVLRFSTEILVVSPDSPESFTQLILNRFHGP